MENIKNKIEINRTWHQTCNHINTFIEHHDVEKDGPLSGYVVTLKDNISTKGVATTASSKILSNYTPVFNATVVEKLQQAGACIIAKTSMDELGMGGTNMSAYTGPVLNPFDTRRISGGSSGGSAVSVAIGGADISIGSDTGDSIRKPASYCGIVGVKPTYGRISRYGVIPYASSLDHVGYFTNNVKDSAIVLESLAGRDDKDLTSSSQIVEQYSSYLTKPINGLTVGVLENIVDKINNDNIVQSFNDVISELEKRGATIVKVKLNETLMSAYFATYNIIANCEATANHSNLDGIRFGVQEAGSSVEEIMMNSRTKGFGINVRKRFVTGSYGLFEENQEDVFFKAQRVRRLIVEDITRAMSGIDVLCSPASGQIAPLLNNIKTLDQCDNDEIVVENYMVMANFSGLPSMTVPMTWINEEEKEMPVGLHIMANAFKEGVMFQVAQEIETICNLGDRIAKVSE